MFVGLSSVRQSSARLSLQFSNFLFVNVVPTSMFVLWVPVILSSCFPVSLLVCVPLFVVFDVLNTRNFRFIFKCIIEYFSVPDPSLF